MTKWQIITRTIGTVVMLMCLAYFGHLMLLVYDKVKEFSGGEFAAIFATLCGTGLGAVFGMWLKSRGRKDGD